MKSYLAGNPELRLALNEDLVVGGKGEEGYGKVVLDDLNFNECVNLAGEGKEGKEVLGEGKVKKMSTL